MKKEDRILLRESIERLRVLDEKTFPWFDEREENPPEEHVNIVLQILSKLCKRKLITENDRNFYQTGLGTVDDDGDGYPRCRINVVRPKVNDLIALLESRYRFLKAYQWVETILLIIMGLIGKIKK